MQKLYIFIIIIYLFEEQYEFLRLNARGTKSNKAVGNIYSTVLLQKILHEVYYTHNILHFKSISTKCLKSNTENILEQHVFENIKYK